MHIGFDSRAADLTELCVVHAFEAAALFDLARRMLKHVVHEGAYLGRGEPGRLIGLCAQAVLTEIRIFA